MAATKSRTSQEKFSIAQVFTAFASLPRVFFLVWSASAPMTLFLGCLSILRGLTPIVTVSIAQLVIDSVIRGIRIHSISPIWLPVILQLLVSLLDRALVSTNTLVLQLLQDRVANHIQLLILRKANTLDLPLFEDADFYDKLRRATNFDVFTRFRQLTAGKTAIFISHRFSTVRLADRIIVIEHGRMVEYGSHQELISLNGCYAELFNLQAQAYR